MLEETNETQDTKGKGKGKRGLEAERVRDRPYLRVWETMPVLWLNATGIAGYAALGDNSIWKLVSEPQKNGTLWMTEFASESPERRGIAINRWLYCLLQYLLHEETPDSRKYNKFLLKPEIFKAFYEEILRMKPHIEACLAGKKQREPTGAYALRTGATQNQPRIEPAVLANHSKQMLHRGTNHSIITTDDRTENNFNVTLYEQQQQQQQYRKHH